MKKEEIAILLDNGHGVNTPGKRSPDGVLREYQICRYIVRKLYDKLKEDGYNVFKVTPEVNDIPLRERVERCNKWWREWSKKCILVSIHINASGDGSKWMGARGWSAYTSKGQTESDVIADYLYKAAEENFLGDDIKIRKDMSDGDPDWEENFYILTRTHCPAVLTENLFQDNIDDYLYLLSQSGLETIIQLHYDGITEYIKNKKSD